MQFFWALALVLLLAWVAAGGLRSGATGRLACYWPLLYTQLPSCISCLPAYFAACSDPILFCGHWPLTTGSLACCSLSPYLHSAGLPSAYPACLLCPNILCDSLLKGLLMWTITAWPSDPTWDHLQFYVVLYEHFRSFTLLPKNLFTFDVTPSAFSWHGRDWDIINVSHMPI